MDMASMDMAMPTSSPTSMSGSTMMGRMTFFNSQTTSLYSSAWTPHSTGQYAGTCIFLIVFAAVFRALLAFRVRCQRKWWRMEQERKYVIAKPGGVVRETTTTPPIATLDVDVKDKESGRKMLDSSSGDSSSSSSGKSSLDSVVDPKSKAHYTTTMRDGVRPWRVTQDLPLAGIDTVIAGVGYLL